MVFLSSFIKLIFSPSFYLFSFFFIEPKPSTSPCHFFSSLPLNHFFFLLHLSSSPNLALPFSPLHFFISFFLQLLTTHQSLLTKPLPTQALSHCRHKPQVVDDPSLVVVGFFFLFFLIRVVGSGCWGEFVVVVVGC